MNTWNDRPLNGCLFEETIAKAPLLIGVESVRLPSHVDLRSMCSTVEDQGQTNSCTANAVVGALEYHQRQAGLPVTDLSRLFVYFNARKLLDQEWQDCGSFIHHVMASVLAYGACEEKVWPFDPQLCCVQPSPQAYQNAMAHQAIEYGRAPLGISAKAALAEGNPVVFGTYIPQNFYSLAAQTGRMPMPGPALHPKGGGHAMLLVGYDENDQDWIVRNSYGTGFGENGYLRIPFATLAAYSLPVHFWTIGAIAASRHLSFEPDRLPAPDFDSPSHLTIDLTKMRNQLRQKLDSELTQSTTDFRNRLRS